MKNKLLFSSLVLAIILCGCMSKEDQKNIDEIVKKANKLEKMDKNISKSDLIKELTGDDSFKEFENVYAPTN